MLTKLKMIWAIIRGQSVMYRMHTEGVGLIIPLSSCLVMDDCDIEQVNPVMASEKFTTYNGKLMLSR